VSSLTSPSQLRFQPVAIGLNTPTFWPVSVKILAMAPAINVLPAPTSVPVTKSLPFWVSSG